jgi:sigma-B regulation protein RsbU (phosphoserine phosphatase)
MKKPIPPGNESANGVRDAVLRSRLMARRDRVKAALSSPAAAERHGQLLVEVDAALERMEAGTFGLCESCREAIENDRLLADPLAKNCLDHLSAAEQRALERDLDLASQLQRGLLPKPGVSVPGWSVAWHYEPAGTVSGDYCDLIPLEAGQGLFAVGDVSGKGIAASMLMTHLHAIFRSLVGAAPDVGDLLARANRVFCDGTSNEFFATLVCGMLGTDGRVRTANAGHCYPLHLRRGEVRSVPSSGLPLGLFRDEGYGMHEFSMEPGDLLLLYSDGVTETFHPSGEPFGVSRVSNVLLRSVRLTPRTVLNELLNELIQFRSGGPRTDDLTAMVISRQ